MIRCLSVRSDTPHGLFRPSWHEEARTRRDRTDDVKTMMLYKHSYPLAKHISPLSATPLGHVKRPAFAFKAALTFPAYFFFSLLQHIGQTVRGLERRFDASVWVAQIRGGAILSVRFPSHREYDHASKWRQRLTE